MINKWYLNKLISVPDADSDNECSFQGTTSSDNSYERHSKKVKTNESNKLKNLKQFLPNTIILDSTFQPNQKPRKYLGNTDEDVSTDFILFCNHILKQVFGVHGFYERSSLKGGLWPPLYQTWQIVTVYKKRS